MRIHRAISVVLGLLVVGLQYYPAQQNRFLEGVVLEGETNRPLEGVKVSASTDSLLVSGITDPNGRFKIAIAQPGRYRVLPAMNGYVYLRPAHIKTGREPGAWVQIASGRAIPPLELRMVKPGSITGKVLTATGETLPGNTVTLLQYTYDSSGVRTLSYVPGLHFAFEGSFVRMDDRGDYRFYDVPPGDYYIRISNGGFVGDGSIMYYPGTPDETRAMTVHVKAGEELRINTLTLPPKRSTNVRLHFPNPADSPTVQILTLHGTGTSVMGARRGARPDGEDEIALPFAPGHYDLFVGLAPSTVLPGRPVADGLFGTISLDVGDSPIDRLVEMKPGLKINGAATLVNEAGVRSPVRMFPPGGGLMCRLVLDADPSRGIGGSVCFGMQLPAGNYHLELEGLPTDQYVQSATTGDRDVLAEGIRLQSDIDLQVVLATPGAIVEGVVKDASGDNLSDAVVALVPDPPYRATGGVLYRSTISDVNGKFELRGIAPGNYHLFAWPDLEGAAYRNAEFMKKYEDAGKAIRIEMISRFATEVTSR